MPESAGTNTDISFLVRTGSSVFLGTTGTGRDDALISIIRDATFPIPQLIPSPSPQPPRERTSPEQ